MSRHIREPQGKQNSHLYFSGESWKEYPVSKRLFQINTLRLRALWPPRENKPLTKLDEGGGGWGSTDETRPTEYREFHSGLVLD